MNGNSAFVISQAVQLIAADGQYKSMDLSDVIQELLAELRYLDDYFDPVDPEETGTLQ